MVQDGPDSHFFAALQAFATRTCYANSSGMQSRKGLQPAYAEAVCNNSCMALDEQATTLWVGQMRQ